MTEDEEDRADEWGYWPAVSIEAIIAEGKRMRSEGIIIDIETVFGVVTLIKHPLFNEFKQP